MARMKVTLEVDGQIFTIAGEYDDPASAVIQVIWLYDAARKAAENDSV